MKRELLRIEYGEKYQDGIQILKDIYLQVFEKEFFGIIFQNMQEKESFLSIMKGEECFDDGYLYLEECNISVKSCCQQMKKVSAVIGRGETVFANSPVFESIYFMEMNRGRKLVNLDKYEKRTEKLLHKYQLDIESTQNIKHLSMMEKVVIEMLSAYEQGKKVIILEDIIAMLQKKQQNILWNMLQSLKQEGVTFIFVESLNHGILNYVERIAVVEKGSTVGIYDKTQMTEEMLLKVLEKNGRKSEIFKRGETRQIHLAFHRVKQEGLKPVDFLLRKGELIFLLCEDINAYERLEHLILGNSVPDSGMMYYCGQRITAEHMAAYQGDLIGVIREHPVNSMIFTHISVMDNLCLPFARKIPGIWCNRRFQDSVKKKLEDLLPRECYDKGVEELTQSEILKIVYLRWYLYKPEIVICFRPFERGDLEMIQQTQEMIGFLMRKGISVIIITLTLKNVEPGGYEIYNIENEGNRGMSH